MYLHMYTKAITRNILKVSYNVPWNWIWAKLSGGKCLLLCVCSHSSATTTACKAVAWHDGSDGNRVSFLPCPCCL